LFGAFGLILLPRILNLSGDKRSGSERVSLQYLPRSHNLLFSDTRHLNFVVFDPNANLVTIR
jgi:hypothetical protein